MQISKNNIDNLNAIVKIQLTPDDYREKVEVAIKNHSKQVKMPGFRPGMVPASHIKKLYGKSILVEEINRLLSDNLTNYINDNKLEVLGQPLPKMEEDAQYNWDFNDVFDFSYELGLAPEFDVTISDKDKFTQYIIKLDEETMTQRKKNLRRSYGKMSNPEVSAEGDVLYAELKQLTPAGEVFEGGITKTNSIRLDLVEDKAVLKTLVGLKKDDVVTIDLQQAFNKDAHRIALLLDIDEEIARDLKSKFELTVKNVNRLEESDLTQEFFDKVYGPNVITSEAEFEQKIREDLQGIMAENAEKKLHTEVVEGVLSKIKLSLPDDFLKRWLQSSQEKPITNEQIEAEYPAFAKNLKWTLIENKIMKSQNMEFKQDEVIELAKKKIDAQFRMYSPSPLPEDQLMEYTINFLQDRERATRIYDELRAQKVFEYLKNTVALDKKEIDYKKFIELA